MSGKLYTKIDDEGMIILPWNLIETCNISAANRILVDQEGTCLRLRPLGVDVSTCMGLSAAHDGIRPSS